MRTGVGVTRCAPSVRRSVVLGLLELEDWPAAVVPAVQASAMRALRLVAMRALLELGERQREMGAPISLSSVGDLALRHTHGFERLLSMPDGRAAHAGAGE
jgi:hypothetical protein